MGLFGHHDDKKDEQAMGAVPGMGQQPADAGSMGVPPASDAPVAPMGTPQDMGAATPSASGTDDVAAAAAAGEMAARETQTGAPSMPEIPATPMGGADMGMGGTPAADAGTPPAETGTPEMPGAGASYGAPTTPDVGAGMGEEPSEPAAPTAPVTPPAPETPETPGVNPTEPGQGGEGGSDQPKQW